MFSEMLAASATDKVQLFANIADMLTPNSDDNTANNLDRQNSIWHFWMETYNGIKNANTKTTERVSKSFVKGLRARIALVAGGYGLRGDGFRRSNNPELAPEKMYAIAKQECEDVINSGRNKLGTFKENFVKLCEDNVTAGGESLWEIPFSDGRGRVLYTFGIKHNAKDQYTQQAHGVQTA